MRRRLVLSNVLLVTIVLLALEIPLGVVYARHQHDTMTGELQRDAGTLALLSEEIIEHPGDHDVGGLAQRFTGGAGETIVIIDRSGTPLTPPSSIGQRPASAAALAAARSGRATGGEDGGQAFLAVPVGGAAHGAVLVARSDRAIDDRIRQFWLILVAIAAAVLGIAVAVSLRLARWAVRPLRVLEEHATALGRGDMDARAETTRAPQEVRALAASFNVMADRLDELITSQRRFVADASHQLRTPLTALRLRLENLDPEDPATVAATREAALLEASRLSRLVDGLLALARAERQRPDREPIDVAAVVEQRHDAWTPLAAERAIDLRLEANGGGPITAMAVPGHLDQILDNLIDNAVDATPPGGQVSLSVHRSSHRVEVHVVDGGPGMTDDERRRAFAPFWQGSGPPGGAGLGLAIVDQLARASHGVVNLERAPGGGIDATVALTTA